MRRESARLPQNKNKGFEKRRHNSWRQFDRLRLIIYLRRFGLSLTEIGVQIEKGNGEQYVNMLRNHCAIIEQKIHEWTTLRQLMEQRIKEIEEARKAPHNRVFFEQFPEQRVRLFRRIIEGHEEHERMVLDSRMKYSFPPGIGRFGQVFSLERIIQRRDDACDGIFVAEETLSDEMPGSSQETYYCFPAGLYAVMYYRKPTEESYPFWDAMLYEINKQSYEPAGYIIRTVVFEKGRNAEREDYLACLRLMVTQKTTSQAVHNG